jgi:hypothetical protein
MFTFGFTLQELTSSSLWLLIGFTHRIATMQRLLVVSFVALFASVQSLDVEIVGVKCDESLPVTADIKLKDCAAGSRCTFGQEATVYGSRTLFDINSP